MRRLTLLLSLALVIAGCADDTGEAPASPGQSDASANTAGTDTASASTTAPSGADEPATTGPPATSGAPSTTSSLSSEAEAALERAVYGFLVYFGFADPADDLIAIFFPENSPQKVDQSPADDMPPSHTLDAYAGGIIDLESNPFAASGFNGQVFGDNDLEPGQYMVGLFLTGGPISLSPDGQSQFGFSYRYQLEEDGERCEAPGEPYHNSSRVVILDLTFGSGSVFGLQCSGGSFGGYDLQDAAFFTLPDLGDNVLGYAYRVTEPGVFYEVNPWSFFRSPDNSFAVEDGRFHAMFDPDGPTWPIVFSC